MSTPEKPQSKSIERLKREFERRQKSDPRYSLRQFAIELQLSKSMLSSFFRGDRLPGNELAYKIDRFLENRRTSPKLVSSSADVATLQRVLSHTLDTLKESELNNYLVFRVADLKSVKSRQHLTTATKQVVRDLLRDMMNLPPLDSEDFQLALLLRPVTSDTEKPAPTI